MMFKVVVTVEWMIDEVENEDEARSFVEDYLLHEVIAPGVVYTLTAEKETQ